MHQHSTCYESTTHPLHYADCTLAQRGDVVLYLSEQDGRITQAQIARVWDAIYYDNGLPIGIVLVDAESPKDSLPELFTFVHKDEITGEAKNYFRGKLTIPQAKVATSLCPLFRSGRYLKKWDKENKRISVMPNLSEEPYPEPEDIYDDFFRETVVNLAKQGNPHCLFTAGLWQRNNYYPHRALEFFRAAAQQNFPPAWLELGFAYQGSDLLTANSQKAAACFQQAMSLGNALAAYQLALCYISGNGVSHSDEAAIICLKTAIEGDIMPARLTLALYYRQGSFHRLLPKNSPYRHRPALAPKHKSAFNLLLKAAETPWAEQAIAKFYLAECYRLGEGTRPNPERAKELYQDASNTGDIMNEDIQSACFYAGNILRLNLAAEHGSPYAAYLLGRMLWNGEHAEKNRHVAKRYLKVASESAHECAELAVQLLQQKEDLSWAFGKL